MSTFVIAEDFRDLASTAYHEAGHAVAFTIAHYEVTSVSIEPGYLHAEHRNSGRPLYRGIAYPTPLPLDKCGDPLQVLPTYVACVLAGPMAQSRYMGIDAEIGKDLDDICRACKFFDCTEEETCQVIKDAFERVAKLFQTAAWTAVPELVLELLEKRCVEGSVVRDIVHRHCPAGRP